MQRQRFDKFLSGRYLLCVSASICIVMLTLATCINTVLTRNLIDVNPQTLAMITVLTNVLTAITTHYFTKQRSNPSDPPE